MDGGPTEEFGIDDKICSEHKCPRTGDLIKLLFTLCQDTSFVMQLISDLPNFVEAK